jgi:hypothetical protein
MAPERFRGVTDRRGDIYALGATLYEMLALRPAFAERDHVQLIDQITHQAPTSLRQHERRIPRDLETIVAKALAKDPKDRFATAGELRDELQRFLQSRPIRSRPIGLAERLWRWCRRNPLVAGLNALAAALTIIIAVVSSIAAYRNGRLAEQLKGQRDEANQNLIQAYTAEAEAHRVSRRVGQRFEALDAIERAMRLAPEVGITEDQRLRLRNEAIAAMALPDLRIAKELNVPLAHRNGFAVDPSFERYATKLDDGTVVVRRLADDAELLRLPGLPTSREHTSANFSPDGRYLAMTSGGKDILQVWDLREQRLVLTDSGMAWANPINWSFRPDGRELAIGRADRSIVFYELPSGKLLRRWTEYSVTSGNLAYSPDGSKLAIGADNGSRVMIVSREKGRLLATLPHTAHANHFVWNPRRPNILAVTCEDNQIYIWDVATGKQTMTLRGETYNGMILAYHPGGELLASCGWHGVLRLWDTRTGRQLMSQPSNWSSTLEFDRTGRWLSVDATHEKARILEVAAAAECRSLVAEPFREGDRFGAGHRPDGTQGRHRGARRDRGDPVGPLQRDNSGDVAAGRLTPARLRCLGLDRDRPPLPAAMAGRGGVRWRHDHRSASYAPARGLAHLLDQPRRSNDRLSSRPGGRVGLRRGRPHALPPSPTAEQLRRHRPQSRRAVGRHRLAARW